MSVVALSVALAIAFAHEHHPHVESKIDAKVKALVAAPRRQQCYRRPLEQGGPGNVTVCPGGVL